MTLTQRITARLAHALFHKHCYRKARKSEDATKRYCWFCPDTRAVRRREIKGVGR